MDTNYIIYTLIAICLFFSALLSGSETAITLVPREKVHQLDDTKRNNKIRKAKDDLELTIGGILVANNFVNILMASLATVLFVRITNEENLGSALATVFITILVLVFGEITPKTLASRNPVGFLNRTAFLIDLLARVFAPFTNLITNSIDKGTRTNGDMDGDNEITEADIQALTALGEMEGQILPAEREIIDSLLDFSDRPIKEIMTPRVMFYFCHFLLT